MNNFWTNTNIFLTVLNSKAHIIYMTYIHTHIYKTYVEENILHIKINEL